jgi:two-component system chemotaxis sensor kinase CheA
LGKPEPKVVVDVGDIRLPPNLFAPLWASFAHLIRNIVDHALEAPEVRLQAGKPSESRVDLRVTETAQGIEITVSDDGRGIDWDNIRARARTKGLRSATQADLVSALLSPGFSTAESVSLTSGRGVGLSAVATAVRALGGTLEIESTKGVGTRFTINVKPQSRISDSVSPRLNKRPLSIPPPKA